MASTFDNRTVLISGVPSCAKDGSTPSTPAAPADDNVAKNSRRLCLDGIIGSPILKTTLAWPDTLPHGKLRSHFLHHNKFSGQCPSRVITGVPLPPPIVRFLQQLPT